MEKSDSQYSENNSQISMQKNPDYSYQTLEIASFQELLRQVDELQVQIDIQKPLSTDVWETIQQKLKIDWTYDSNAIEGSSLTRGETLFFLQEGLTVEGKPFKDFLDARNHAEAIDFLYGIITDERPVSAGLMKEINALLLSGVSSTPAMNQMGQKVQKKATPGEYKKQPNHVLQADGTIHHYVEPEQVPGEIEKLCLWINEGLDKLPPLIVATVAHYNLVRIHPFDDGNGRGARILMNLILIKKGYPPAIIKNTIRRAYLAALNQADQGDITPFVELVCKSLIETQEEILENLNK